MNLELVREKGFVRGTCFRPSVYKGKIYTAYGDCVCWFMMMKRVFIKIYSIAKGLDIFKKCEKK